MVDSNFAFIDSVSAVYYGGQAGYAHTKNDYVIDNNVKPALIWRTHTAPMDKYHLH